MAKISYNSYLTFSEPQKISLFDDGVPLLLFQSEKYKREFLKEVIGKNNNNYLRKKALENLALMSIYGETPNKNDAISVLLDIENDDEPFVLVSKIKFLFILNEKLELNDNIIINQIDQLRFHEHGDVSSEAYYYSGLTELLMANSTNNEIDFFKNITSTSNFFKGAVSISENRLDASLLLEICNLIILSTSGNTIQKDKCLSKIKSILAERKYSYIYSDIPNFEIWIYRIVTRISKILNSKVDEWLNIKTELNEICCFHYDMIDLEISKNLSGTNTNFKTNINDYVLKPFYRRSLNQHLSAIKRLSRESIDNIHLRDFCTYLVDSIEKNDLKKKPDFDKIVQITKALPDVNQEKLLKDIQGRDLEDIGSIIDLFGSYILANNIKHPTSLTGDHVGDEIFHNLIQEIDTLIPDYSPSKLLEFKVVLSDIIRYMLSAITQKSSGSSFFKFLFNQDAVENDLQDSMFAFLGMNSTFGTRYKKEISEVADGGRVDILYNSDKVTIPIELKKTDHKPTTESIAENYLAQAQTYCYPYDQLGLFILLDNSNKASELQSPINDIRELFDIRHMEPYYKIKEKAPNYIITVIVPGNKITPSVRSKYK